MYLSVFMCEFLSFIYNLRADDPGQSQVAESLNAELVYTDCRGSAYCHARIKIVLCLVCLY